MHGQRNLLDTVKGKLSGRFRKENMRPASLEKVGDIGEYVAMIWPPVAPREIVVSVITGTAASPAAPSVAGAWAFVIRKELFRLPLE